MILLFIEPSLPSAAGHDGMPASGWRAIPAISFRPIFHSLHSDCAAKTTKSQVIGMSVSFAATRDARHLVNTACFSLSGPLNSPVKFTGYALRWLEALFPRRICDPSGSSHLA